MNILTSILLSLILLLLTTCSTTTNLQTEKTIDKPTSPPILEITEDAHGMWSVTGKTLLFRLYENQVVEFEYPDDTKIKLKQNKTEEVNTLKRIKISEIDNQKFTELLNSKDFQQIQERYQSKCCCTDATTSYKINFQSVNKQREINVVGYCGLGEIMEPQNRNISDFPKVISNLMTLVYEIRLKFQPSNKPQ